MLLLDESEIRELADVTLARQVVRDAFAALHRGEATLPSIISMPFHAPEGVAHIKAGHLHADPTWTLKVSADFVADNGLPTRHSGLMLVISSVDGTLVAVLRDNGYLTELRTGAAGAIAADLLARADATTVAIIGAGSQARFQLDALLDVRPIERVRVASRSQERAQAFVDEIENGTQLAAALFDSVQEAVDGADVVVTTTQSTAPLVHADWLAPGAHVTAVGSDEPSKQELATDVLERAAVVAVDDRDQTSRFGELHHALEAGVLDVSGVVTLGQLIDGQEPGRTAPDDLTVADLTGVGIQDAAIAAFIVRAATRRAG
jgi:ornithine cyclodeaminase/alanine dehydrogenase-like protein (mu-crystallin family)